MAAQEENQADLATKSLPVAEIIAIVQEWVDLYACRRPDFAGAEQA